MGHRRGVRDGEECNVRINRIDIRVFEFEIGEPFQMGMDLVEGGSCEFP